MPLVLPNRRSVLNWLGILGLAFLSFTAFRTLTASADDGERIRAVAILMLCITWMVPYPMLVQRFDSPLRAQRWAARVAAGLHMLTGMGGMVIFFGSFFFL